MPPRSFRPSHQRSYDALVRNTSSRPSATPIIVCAIAGILKPLRSSQHAVSPPSAAAIGCAAAGTGSPSRARERSGAATHVRRSRSCVRYCSGAMTARGAATVDAVPRGAPRRSPRALSRVRARRQREPARGLRGGDAVRHDRLVRPAVPLSR